MIKIIVAKIYDDSPESHDLQNREVNTTTPSTSHHVRGVQRKEKKFIVSTETPAKTTDNNLPHRGQRRDRVSKFQTQHNNVTRGITSPVQRTRPPKLMQTKKITRKPNAIDHAEERSKFIKRRSHSNFNKFDNEEKYKITEKNNSKINNSEHVENNFKHFTDIDISSENNSNETKETEKRSHRRYMKTAASDKVKTIISPPFLRNVNTQRNYKIRDLFKIQKYNPTIERKMVPALALQKESSGKTGGQNATITSKNFVVLSTNRNDLSPEDDQNEFIFIKEEDKLKSRTITSSEDNEIVTIDPIILI